MLESFLNNRVVLHPGDCLDVLARLEENSIDACVTDPPYGLQFMGREWDRLWRNSTDADAAYVERTAGELTSRARKLPDYNATNPQQMQRWHEAWAREVYRVLKPGGHILAFGGTRTYHRMACAIEDAGFEIRDCVQWIYGSGFPKSLDVSKAIDKANGVRGEYGDPKTAAHAGWIDRGRMRGGEGHEGFQRPWMDDKAAVDRAARQYIPGSPEACKWSGFGTALKPACEPIVLARKPLSESTVAANVLRWGCGALNIDECRVETAVGDYDHPGNSGIEDERNVYGDFANGNQSKPHNLGRWPANVIHDGSEDVVGAFPDAPGQQAAVRGNEPSNSTRYIFNGLAGRHLPREPVGDSGSAARFFYTAKADSDDRIGSKHPTVKPLDLMQYLVRLITPPRGLVLDPFAGTGTTGEAAWREGMRGILIEREAEYQDDIRRRMKLCLAGPDERAREAIKARGLTESPGPLFDKFAEAAE